MGGAEGDEDSKMNSDDDEEDNEFDEDFDEQADEYDDEIDANQPVEEQASTSQERSLEPRR